MRLNKLTLIIASTSIAFTTAYADNTNSSAALSISKPVSTCVAGNAQSSGKYDATRWYRDSAERNAQYNQVFAIGLEKVATKVQKQKLKSNQWGVIMDIDETVLDNSQYEKENILSCQDYTPQSNYAFMERKVSIATPGAHNFTCGVQKLGGKVVLVTNRDGSYDDKIQSATVDNLRAAGICFDNVVFANGSKDSNKTPRFQAVEAGNYSNIIAIHPMKPFKVLAYFGDNIQDFPDITQAEAIKQDPNGSYWQKFGQEYFSLPNPTYGSWERNQFN